MSHKILGGTLRKKFSFFLIMIISFINNFNVSWMLQNLCMCSGSVEGAPPPRSESRLQDQFQRDAESPCNSARKYTPYVAVKFKFYSLIYFKKKNVIVSPRLITEMLFAGTRWQQRRRGELWVGVDDRGPQQQPGWPGWHKHGRRLMRLLLLVMLPLHDSPLAIIYTSVYSSPTTPLWPPHCV
jgi:hypothetical protein